MVAAAHAVAWEEVPGDRMTLSWVLRRRYRTGHTLGLVARRRGGVTRRAIKAGARVVRGAGTAALGVVTSSTRLVRGLTDVAWGVGTLVALVSGRPFSGH
jgi:hypothetical protein